jgi:hypothetical protein
MDILDELRGDIRPIARRINLAPEPYAAFCVALWLLCQELRLTVATKQEALDHTIEILDGEPPSKRSGLRGITGSK